MSTSLFLTFSLSALVLMVTGAGTYYVVRYRRICWGNRRALEYMEYSMYDEALKLLQNTLDLDPAHPLTNYNMGFILYYGKKLPDRALKCFLAALKADPRMAAAQYATGHLLFHVRKDSEGARRHLEQAISLNPELAEAHNTLGFVAIACNDWHEAARRFRIAAQANACYDAAWCNLAVACINQGHISEAIDAGKEYAARQPSSPVAHSNLGNLYGLSGMAQEAVAAFSRAIQLDAENWMLYFWTGCLRLKQKEYARAVVLFNEAIRLHGDMALIHYNLALAHEALGSCGAAHVHITRALTLDPALGTHLFLKGDGHGFAGMPETIGGIQGS